MLGLASAFLGVPAAGHLGQDDPPIWSGTPSQVYQPVNINTVRFDGQTAPNGHASGSVDLIEFDTKNIPKDLTFDGVDYPIPASSTVFIEHFAGNWQINQGNNFKFLGKAHSLTIRHDGGDPTYTRSRVLIQTEPATNGIGIDMLLNAAGVTVRQHAHVPAASPVPIYYLHDVSKTSSEIANSPSVTISMEPCNFQGTDGSCLSVYDPDPTLINQFVPVVNRQVCLRAPETPTLC
ncbi:MAG: hypothetical protein HY556_11925 [Euryarchaeota archaeon]|nr:hypothetical protein [Euryarchaeota archaeon]